MGKKTEALLWSLKGRKEDYLDADDKRAEAISSRKRKQRSSDPEKDRQDRMKQAATKQVPIVICLRPIFCESEKTRVAGLLEA